jgi:2-polyprenyl-3-methyl-5-hydroxy-6-metoxy-1,4-benzoquinol methylase
MKAAQDKSLVSRYKKNYGIRDKDEITESMVLRHWELERSLTKELLESNPANRWEVFSRCYGRLYRELDWLNELVGTSQTPAIASWHRVWSSLVGEPPKRILEVGSGRGETIAGLAERGHVCTAAEITRERGERYATTTERLSWTTCDGVHLERFEEPNTYDVVLSDELLEHLPPDDVLDHFKGVFAVLKNGGRYIFCTPHEASGPCDVSRVFGCEEPLGMHLKEYTYRELARLCAQAGFRETAAVLIPPAKLARVLRRIRGPVLSRAALRFDIALERLILFLPNQRLGRGAVKLSRVFLFRPNIFMVATKPSGGDAGQG